MHPRHLFVLLASAVAFLGFMAVSLAGPADVKPLPPGTGLKPFPYTKSPDALPNAIASLETSNLSIMPAGFGSLPPSDLSALLEYLASGSPDPPQK